MVKSNEMVDKVEEELRKKGEELQKSKKRELFLSNIIEYSSQPFSVWYPDGRLGLVNKAFEELTGYTKEELKNMDWSEHLTPPEFRDMEQEKLEELQHSGEPIRYEKEYLRKNCSRVPIELLVNLVRNENGDTKYYYSFITNVTERKKSEDKTQKLLVQLQQVNEELKVSNEELQSTTDELRISNEELQNQRDNLISLNQALRISEKKYENLFETMVQGVVYHDAEGHIISMNPAAEEILGFTFDIIKYKTSNDSIWQAIHEDGTPFPGEEHPAMVALKTGKEVKNVIMGVKNPSKNGYRWLNIHAVPELRQWEDKPYQVYTTFEDITDRKQIEAALKESEISLGEAQRIANIGSWEWNIQKDDITWSNELYSIYGVDPNTFTPTISSFADYIHPDDQETVNNIINQIISQGISVDFDFRIISTDGSTHILNTVAEVTDFDEDGNPRLMVGINQDITERREKELLNNALNKVNAYINSTLEYDEIMQLIMDLGAKALNVESSIINVREGDNWVVKFAYNFPDDIIGQIRSNKESPTSVYVEDRKEAVAFNDAANDSRVNKDGMKLHGVTSLLVAPIILKDEFKGIIAFYHHQKSVIFSEEEIDFANKLAFYLSQAIENATLFNEIRNSEEKYHSLYSSMREGVALHEIIYNQSQEAVDYIILDINPAYEKITGLNRSEVVGMKASVLYGTGTPPYLEFYAPVAENAEPTEFESYFEPMDKTFHISVVSPGKGKFATIFEDITERKQAEELLQNTLLRFYNIFSSMYGAILLVTDKNRVEFVNQAFCDLFEFDDSPQNLMGLNAYEMIEKIQNVYLNPKEALIRIDEIVSRGKPVKGEEVALRGGRTVMRDFIPIYVDEISFGRLWHHVDITERKNAEKASSDLASIVENSDDAIIGKVLAGIITSWNNGAEKIYGYSTSEAIGRNINFLIPKNYPDDTKLLLDKVRNHIKVFNHETKRLTKDGKIIDVSITVSPIINSD